jgi:dipeptidyl aminopeptidase/acylaminoacyl peptidase
VSVSDGGVMVYQAVNPAAMHLVWLDRTGKPMATVPMAPGPFFGLVLSPDRHRVLTIRPDPQTASDLWLVELDRGTATRLTFKQGNEFFAVWAPDGSHVVYASNRNGPYNIYQKPVTGSGQEELLYHSEQLKKWPSAWSPDGRFIVFTGSDNTGHRWGELIRADPADLQGGVLIVHHTKSRKVRRVPIPAWFREELRCRIGRFVPLGNSDHFKPRRSTSKRGRTVPCSPVPAHVRLPVGRAWR